MSTYTEAGRKTVRAWQDRNPIAKKAHSIVFRAIKQGKLTRPDRCDNCGKPCKPHAHHENYYQPLLVDWLCNSCHKFRHQVWGKVLDI